MKEKKRARKAKKEERRERCNHSLCIRRSSVDESDVRQPKDRSRSKSIRATSRVAAGPLIEWIQMTLVLPSATC
jgi:hypothetical protein